MKSDVVVLYGSIGVGKLTIAQMLSERIGYQLSHNHLVVDLVHSLFENNTRESSELSKNIRLELYERATSLGKNFVITYTYAHNHHSLAGQSDPEYLKELKMRLEKAGAHIHFVHLLADHDVLLERVQGESRKKFNKLTNISIMKKYLDNNDIKTSADIENQLILDTSHLSPEQSVQKIIDFLDN